MFTITSFLMKYCHFSWLFCIRSYKAHFVEVLLPPLIRKDRWNYVDPFTFSKVSTCEFVVTSYSYEPLKNHGNEGFQNYYQKRRNCRKDYGKLLYFFVKLLIAVWKIHVTRFAKKFGLLEPYFCYNYSYGYICIIV